MEDRNLWHSAAISYYHHLPPLPSAAVVKKAPFNQAKADACQIVKPAFS